MVIIFVGMLAVLSSVNRGLAADSATQPTPEVLVELLRAGGYSLYFRHEATDWSQSDDVRKAGDWLSCDGERMRQLSSAGRERAAKTGEAIRSLGIPVGRVLASPYCRAMETAELMNIGAVEPTTDVVNLRVAEYFGGRSAIIRTATALLASKPAAGTNTVIVAHGNVAREATPVYPAEGEAVVFESDSKGGFRLTGTLSAQDWQRLASGI
jgi:phosphohistidine phosphatase SixA